MPSNKDFKRLTRLRMAKTGESYTTARAHLIEKHAISHADLTGMSDAAVGKATGHDWQQWVELLDIIFHLFEVRYAGTMLLLVTRIEANKCTARTFLIF